jgi:anhydro-N-acetylmuramic acid kinase
MISGTSFDAVEAALVEISLDGEAMACELLEHRSVPYPVAISDAIGAILPPAATTIERVCRLDTEIGQFFAAIAQEMIVEHGPIDAVCSHGQTVFHWVAGEDALGTLQIGQPAWIAERTGAPVVSDVRSRDIAAGGQGAPLASLLDVLLLGASPTSACASLNLGGISNATILRPDRAPVAFDIGPANALLDAVVEWRSGGRERFDRDGVLGAGGTIDTELLARLLDDPYFSLPAPKSTGKEYFNLAYVTGRLGRNEIATVDLVATLTEFTAITVADALRAADLRQLLVAGGGTRNPTLMSALAARLPGVKIERTDELGVPEAAKEALVFAIIGFLTLSGLTATVPSCTGAGHASVLGSVTPGSGPLPAPPQPLPPMPTRLAMRPALATSGDRPG